MSEEISIVGSSASFSNLYSNDLDGSNEHATRASWAGVQIGATAAFFISFWAKFDTVTGNHRIVSCGSTAASGHGWSVVQIGSNIRWVITNSGLVRTQQMTTSGNIITTGTWNHYAIRRTDNTVSGIEIYKDGVLQSINAASTLLTTDTPLYGTFDVGRRLFNNDQHFDGKLANVGIFNVAGATGTAAELTTLKMGDLRTCSIGANLQGAWYFPNGTSDYPDWIDYSGGGHDLTMTNQESADINTDIPL